jgi:hypothetical protein
VAAVVPAVDEASIAVSDEGRNGFFEGYRDPGDDFFGPGLPEGRREPRT